MLEIIPTHNVAVKRRFALIPRSRKIHFHDLHPSLVTHMIDAGMLSFGLVLGGAAQAAAKFPEGFNGAQSDLFSFCDDLGMDRNAALKIAFGFG